jgi:hypothetical protein
MPRTNFVINLQKHFKVNCAGPHLNNVGYVIPRDRILKLDFLRKHKLNIAFENGISPGYVTEKIFDAFYGNTLPVYWGSFTQSGQKMLIRDFNPDCVLYCHSDFNMEQIKDLLVDKKKWCDIMSQPRFVDNIPTGYTNIDNFLDWFCHMVYKG